MSEPEAAPTSFSVLVVTAEPDDRHSTQVLRRIVDELDRREGVGVTTVFLRPGTTPADGWGRVRVVDDLRTHWFSRVLAVFGSRPSGWFRGWTLRRWMAEGAAGVVVLDDGLGERVVQSIRPRPVVVIRSNEALPASAELEPPPLRTADLVLRAPEANPETPDSLESGHLLDAQRRASRAANARAAIREGLSVPPEERLLVGWGPDPWLDGTGLFIRTLWYIQQRSTMPIHGLWLGLDRDDAALAELQMEVERCGLVGRMHFQDLSDEATKWSGDAVFLPHRTEVLDLDGMLDVVAAGLQVVTFAPAILHDPAFRAVSPLDLDSAAQLLTEALHEDPQRKVDRTRRLDVANWVSSFLEAAGQQARGR